MKTAPDRPLIMPKLWLVSNCGIPISVHGTKSEAIRSAVEHVNAPWTECRDYMEVRKVTIVEGW